MIVRDLGSSGFCGHDKNDIHVGSLANTVIHMHACHCGTMMYMYGIVCMCCICDGRSSWPIVGHNMSLVMTDVMVAVPSNWGYQHTLTRMDHRSERHA